MENYCAEFQAGKRHTNEVAGAKDQEDACDRHNRGIPCVRFVWRIPEQSRFGFFRLSATSSVLKRHFAGGEA
jgi:hypothetical protein